jgi:hypothetical protein
VNGLDAWLEAPYVNRAREEEAFEHWCEETGTDPDAPGAWDRFEEDMEEDRRDAEMDAAEARAEEAHDDY